MASEFPRGKTKEVAGGHDHEGKARFDKEVDFCPLNFPFLGKKPLQTLVSECSMELLCLHFYG